VGDAPAGDRLLVEVLGGVSLTRGDEVVVLRRPLERGLLVRLALAGGAVVPDEALIADLWEEDDDEEDVTSRRARLRVAVSRLRRSLGAAAGNVVRVGGGYRAVVDVPDLREARAAADRLHAAVRSGDHRAARTATEEALGRWRGPALSDLRSFPFARAEGERLDAWRLELDVARLGARTALGDGADLVAPLAELAAAHPWHEPLRGMLAVALYRAGRQADALAELAGLRAALADELGVDPTGETLELELRLLRQDPGLLPAPVVPAAVAPAAPTEIGPALARGIVGRRPELVVLAERLDAALSGRPEVVLVEGGPGIGRTRLLEALADVAEQHGVTVCWGRATTAPGAPPFWSWRQALRQVPAQVGVATRPRSLGRIVPELGPAGEDATPGAVGDSEDRFGLFEHVVAFLDEAAGTGPGLVLLLDDLHLADLATVLLLAHVARCQTGSRLLVAASLRPRELSADQARARTDLLRQPATTRIELAGLGPEAVAEQLALVLGRSAEPSVADDVARRTGGNPLFVQELGRTIAAQTQQLVDGGARPSTVSRDGLPAAVRDAVAAQLDALPGATRRALAAAAVLSGEVEAELVAAATDEPVADVLDHLDVAEAAAFLEGADRPDRFRFANQIVRDAVALDLGTGARSRVHLRAAEHLASLGDARLVEIAHHRLAALPLGDRAEAVRAASAAADLALRQLAFEDAAALYDRALAAGGDVATRADLLLARARAQHLGHDVAGAMASCEEVAVLAEHAGDTALLARAAIAVQDVGDAGWLATIRRWCRTALAALPAGDTPMRAQLMAQLAVASTWNDDGVARDSAAGPDSTGSLALDMGERLGDSSAVYTALRAQQLALAGPDGTADRLGLADRMLGLVPAVGDTAELWGRLWRFDALVQLGRLTEADVELDALEPVVTRMRQPLASWHLVRSRAALLAGRGRFAEARRATDEAVAVAARGRHRSAEYPSHALRLAIAELTGDPVDPVVFEIEREAPPPHILSTMAAICYARHGNLDEARRIAARLPTPGSVPLRPFMHLMSHAADATLAAWVGDDAVADHAYAELLPYAHLHATVGAGVGNTGGSVHLVLGTVAEARGRTDDAVEHFRSAVAANDAAGLAPYATLARFGLARVLRRRGDLVEADAAASEAAATAGRLGMPLP
jgi:DNA-binding SARP family transcriptional activator/tetratricopeptide (TPR) repeat protein